jgi:segregation and condensation protein B
MVDHNFKAVIEALLFVSERPVLIEQIRSVLSELDSAKIREILEKEYINSNRGMRVVEVAGGFQMVTASELSSFLKKFYRKPPERLSGPTLETLSIIAYKQPVTRMEIEGIRGVDVSGIVKSLINKGLVRTAGRKKAPGRPFVYATTRQFLEYFGLKSLEELPKIEEFAKTEAKR